MVFAARKWFNVMPGVRMTLSIGGVTTSTVVRGARVRRIASGRMTCTVELPGSVRHTRTVGGGSVAGVPAKLLEGRA